MQQPPSPHYAQSQVPFPMATTAAPYLQQQQPNTNHNNNNTGNANGSGNTVSIPTDASPTDVYEILTDAKHKNSGSSDKKCKVLPPGWEQVSYQGTVVYVDHISREAHEELPWEVWRRRAAAAE